MLKLNFTPFPELETNRLDLKRVSSKFLTDLFEIRSDEETMRFIPRPVAKTHEEAQLVIDMIDEAINKNEGINWGLYLKETGKLIGIAGFVRINKGNHRGEVGYVLNSAYHKKGFMKEALDVIL
ncbi:MAG: GNAT family N-acetyltransferase, partial [Bacteroidia bacterium]